VRKRRGNGRGIKKARLLAGGIGGNEFVSKKRQDEGRRRKRFEATKKTAKSPSRQEQQPITVRKNVSWRTRKYVGYIAS